MLLKLGDDLAPAPNWWPAVAVQTQGARLPSQRRTVRVDRSQRRTLEGLARKAARRIGTMIWSAKDVADLDDMLDASVDDKLINEQALWATRSLFTGQFDEVSDLESFALAVSSRARDENLFTEVFWGASLLDLGAKVASKHRPVTAERNDGELKEHEAPTEMLRASIAVKRSIVCLAALADLATSDRIAPSWLIRKVVAYWSDGGQAFLRMLAMMYGGEDIPESMLPAEQRITKGALLQKHREEEALFQNFIAESVAHR